MAPSARQTAYLSRQPVCQAAVDVTVGRGFRWSRTEEINFPYYLEYFAEHALKIRPKAGPLEPFRYNVAQVEPYPVEFRTDRQTNPFRQFLPGSVALYQFDLAAKEWIGLIAYRLMGKTDALFPGP